MLSLKQVENLICEKLPDAQVVVKDLKGGDHLEAIVVSSEFEGKTRVQQHQLIYGALQQALASEAIHALALKTYTPDSWVAAGKPI